MKFHCVAKIQGGYAFKSDMFQDTGIPIIRIGNLDGQKVELDEEICYPEEFWNLHPEFRVEKNDILVAMSGATVGKVGIYEGEEKALLNQRVCVIRPVNNQLDRRYLYFYCMSSSFNESIQKNAFGCAQPNISTRQIGEFEISVPDINKQAECVEILQKVKGIIERRKRQLVELDSLIKSRFVEMFGEYKYTTELSRYIEELRGGKSLAGTEPCKNKVLKTGAATFGWFDSEQYKYLPQDYDPLLEHKVETGDVIISRMNTPELVGACSYVFEAPENMYYPDRLWKVIPKQNTNPIFLWQLLWEPEIRRQIKEKSAGTSGTMHNISKPKLLEIKCIDAPIELQERFADFVTQIDKLKSEVQKSLDEMQLLMDSLMQKYFG